MKARTGALVMAAVLVLYLVFVLQYAILLMTSGVALAVGLGAALAVLPLIGAWALSAELLFVARGQRLLARAGSIGALPVDDLPRLPSGRIDPKAADREFGQYQREVENEPESWLAWLRLGLAYDASGDRSRARWATRRAIALERSDQKLQP